MLACPDEAGRGAAHALRDRGATEVLGIPGDFVLPFFRVMEESGVLPLHTLSHEPAVDFAAYAAGRAGGALGVAAVTYGKGALHLTRSLGSRHQPGRIAASR
jgi:indolepyruvate decarboxylase